MKRPLESLPDEFTSALPTPAEASAAASAVASAGAVGVTDVSKLTAQMPAVPMAPPESRPDPSPRLPHAQRQAAVRSLIRRILKRNEEYQSFGENAYAIHHEGPRDYLILTPGEGVTAHEVFPRLRWGGCVAVVSPNAAAVWSAAREFNARSGFAVDVEPASFHAGLFGLRLPFGRKLHYFIARKVSLIWPGQVTERFTFDVRLVRAQSPQLGYMVMKQVPSYGYVYQRLRQRFPEADAATNYKRTHKLIDHVFPVFLTREAAFLQILQRDLPQEYRRRVPTAMGVEKGSDGLVRRLYMNWLRLGGNTLSQLQFAQQAADLLRVLHDHVRLIHLDLRLDNMVITRDGVGFVDFGSAVRMGENLKQSPMLDALFDQMMSTSQIQVNLGRMIRAGHLTSSFMVAAHGRIDKAVDIFYLAVQMREPHANPDFRNLVRYEPGSDEARRISLLTDGILRPTDPDRPNYISAKDVCNGLHRVAQKLRK